MTGLLLNDDKGYFDLSITDASFVTDDSLFTQIVYLLYTDKRLPESEIDPIKNRGSIIFTSSSIAQGSYLWTLEQSRANSENADLAASYAKLALAPLVENNLVKNIEAIGFIRPQGVGFTLILTLPTGETSSFTSNLWERTLAVANT